MEETTTRNETDATAVVGARPLQPYSTVGTLMPSAASTDDTADNNHGIVGIRARSHEDDEHEDSHHPQQQQHDDDHNDSSSRPTSPQEQQEQSSILATHDILGIIQGEQETPLLPSRNQPPSSRDQSCAKEEQHHASDEDDLVTQEADEIRIETNAEFKASSYDYDVNWDMIGHRRRSGEEEEEDDETNALNQSTCSSLAEAAAATAMLATTAAAATVTEQDTQEETSATNMDDVPDDDDPLQQVVPMGRRTRSTPQPRMYSRTARPPLNLQNEPLYYYRQYNNQEQEDNEDDDEVYDENDNDLMDVVDLASSPQERHHHTVDHDGDAAVDVMDQTPGALDEYVHRTIISPSSSTMETSSEMNESIRTNSSSSSSGGSIHQRRSSRQQQRPRPWSSAGTTTTISATSSIRPRRTRSSSLNTPQPQPQLPLESSAVTNNNSSGLRASLDSGMASLRRWIISRSSSTSSAVASGNMPRSSRAARRWQREHNNNNDPLQLEEQDLFALSNAGIDPRRHIYHNEPFRTTPLYPPSILEEEESSDIEHYGGRQRAHSEPNGSRLRNVWFQRAASDTASRGVFHRRSHSRDGIETNNISDVSSTSQLSSAALSSSLFHQQQLEMTELSSSTTEQPQAGEVNAAGAAASSSSDAAGTVGTETGATPTEDNAAGTTQDVIEDDPDPNREARTRWIRINRRFQLIITMVALVFSLLLFAILVCWVVLTSAYVISIDKACDVPLKTYFWLATLQLIMDVFRSDIMKFVFRWDASRHVNTQRIPARVITYNIAYLIYAILVLRLGITSVFTTDDSTCSETAPELFQASTVFVTLTIAAWSTIVLGYLVPFCFVATLLTWNGYSPASDVNRDANNVVTPGFGGVFPTAYTMNAGAPPGCIDQLRVVMLEEFPEDYPHECCICMGDFCPGEVIVATECDHVFHKRCCQEWLRQARTCPVCRTDIPTSIGSAASGDNDSQGEEEEEGEQQEQQQQRGVNRRLGQAFGPSGRPFGREEFHQEVVSLLRMLRQHEERLRRRNNNNANDNNNAADTASNEEDNSMRMSEEEGSTQRPVANEGQPTRTETTPVDVTTLEEGRY